MGLVAQPDFVEQFIDVPIASPIGRVLPANTKFLWRIVGTLNCMSLAVIGRRTLFARWTKCDRTDQQANGGKPATGHRSSPLKRVLRSVRGSRT